MSHSVRYGNVRGVYNSDSNETISSSSFSNPILHHVCLLVLLVLVLQVPFTRFECTG